MRIAHRFLGVLGLLTIVLGCHERIKEDAAVPGPTSPAAGAAGAPAGYSLEGPYTQENMSIYVVTGTGRDSREFITLDEGLAAGSVSVREQGGGEGEDRSTVNTLEIENRSDRWLFVQAGDVIKGGKQDRTIGINITLAPHSPSQPIQAFCVEHGRWMQGADHLTFNFNTAIVSGNDLKLAIQARADQREVWKQVALAEARGASVITGKAAARSTGSSAPSLALDDLQHISSTGTYNAILENGKIQKERDRCVDDLLPKLEGEQKVGMVVAFDGVVTAADVYGSPSLFHKLSRKLLQSYALEAVLSRDPKGGPPAPPPSAEAARAFLAEAEKAQGQEEELSSRMHRSKKETSRAVIYEYRDSEATASAAGPGAVETLHRTYMKK